MERQERLENQPLNKSCKSIILKNSNIFCSAFPGKLVFGEVAQQHYLKLNYFEFLTFELFFLYSCIVKIIKSFISSGNDIPSDDELILKINEDTSYLWSISKLNVSNEEEKCILLKLKYKSEIVYQIIFNLDKLNDFINALSEIIVPSLCLQTVEREFFEFISNAEILTIVNLDKPKGLLILKQFFKQMNIVDIDQIQELNLIEIIIYYKELIIIYKKIKSLINPIKDRIQEILSI